MLEFISTDIVQVDADILINPANAKGYMGGFIGKYIRMKGVAESIHYIDSTIEKQAKQLCNSNQYNLGDTFHTAAGKLPFPKGIIHAITMRKPGQKSDITTVEKALKNIIAYNRLNKIESTAIPLLGCGTGRVPKHEVISLYKKYLEPEKTLYYVVEKE